MSTTARLIPLRNSAFDALGREAQAVEKDLEQYRQPRKLEEFVTPFFCQRIDEKRLALVDALSALHTELCVAQLIVEKDELWTVAANA